MNGTPHYLCLYFWLHYAMKFEMMCIHCVIESACMPAAWQKMSNCALQQIYMHAAEKFIKSVFKHYRRKKLNCEMKCYEKQFQSHNARTDY